MKAFAQVKTETEHASGLHSRETHYLSECFHAFMLIYFLSLSNL